MTIQLANSRDIDLTLHESAPDEPISSLVVERAWLPIVIWEGVRVNMRSKRGLTLMERFVIECLLTLNECRAEELLEIASIPPELAGWLLSSLTQKALADRNGNWFRANKIACARALAENCASVEHEEKRSFLWFPETHEVVAIRDAGDLIHRLRHIRPFGTFPLPTEWESRTRGQVIQDAMKRGRLCGDDAEAIWEVNDDETFETMNCPAYQCRAILPHNGSNQWRLTITGYRKRKSRAKPSNENANTSADEIIEQTLTIPVLQVLARSWWDHLENAGDAIRNRLEQRLGQCEVRSDGQELTALLSGNAATELSQERFLVSRIGLGVSCDREIDYTVSLHLRPSPTDTAAQNLFSLDDAVQRIVAAPSPTVVAPLVCTESGVLVSEVIDRLWGLKLFRTVYDLREAEDFVE
jgi:hypothetical protein